MPLEYNIARNTLSLREDIKTNKYRFSVDKRGMVALFNGKPSALLSFLQDKDKNTDRKTRDFEAIIDTGTSGALDPSIKIGSIIISQESLLFDKNISVKANKIPRLGETFFESALNPILGTTLTISFPVDNIEMRDQLFLDKGISTCNMESAKIFQIANSLNMATFSARIVSDWCEGKSLRIFKKSALAHLPKLYRQLLQSFSTASG